VCAHFKEEKLLREHFAAALRLGEGLMKLHPRRAAFKGDMAAVQGAYGDALVRLGKPDEADVCYREALRYLQVVLDSNPDDISQQPLLALAHERLGITAARLGKRPEATKHFQDALQLRTELLMIEPTNLSRKAAYV